MDTVTKLLGERSRTLALKYPVEYDGQVYERITVSRMSAQQMSAFIEAIAEGGDAPRLPMFDVPDEVVAALDSDDADELDDLVRDLLPRRLRTAFERSLESGSPTSPSPQAS